MNSDDLKTLTLWKLRLQDKKANKPLDSEATQYASGQSYDQMPGSEAHL